MCYDRHIRPAILTLLVATSATVAAPRVELSAAVDGARIDVSDDATAVIELAGEGVVPIRWTRGDRARATLPWIVTPGAAPTSIEANGELHPFPADARATEIHIDAAAYAAPWPASDPRRWPMVAATAAIVLILASRVPRHGTLAIVAVSLAITVGLLVFAARRLDVELREQGDITWARARRATVARVAIEPGDVPIVESRSHLRSLAPRIEVDREGRATIELTMGRDARVAVARKRAR